MSPRRYATVGLLALGAGLLPVTAPAVAAATAAVCEVAAPGALEVRAKPGAAAAEPAVTSDAKDLLAGAPTASPSAPGSIVVETWVHVIRTGDGRANGQLTPADVQAQVAALNAAFAGTGDGVRTGTSTPFRFRLAGTTDTVNPAWYAMLPGSRAEREAKSALRRGGKSTLNLYLTGLGGDLLGYAYFPTTGRGKDVVDGVVVLNESIPGGAVSDYAEGDTAPHEVGHWLGLYHTFQNGCSTANDRVADTPAEAVPTTGCPVGKDTCTKDTGLDPVENFMDYSYDRCMYTFTPGQSARMDAVWQRYRAGA